MFLPVDVKFILDTFHKNSYEAFIVGGCVRDSLLKREINDYDITTNANPKEIIKLFKKTIPTGIKHGTISVLLNNVTYEVTTYRVDGDYIDNRRPDSVIFVNNIKDDLSRRDFTINALAYSPYLGFKDFFDGQEDLNKKLIKAVGNPTKRFNEDALRMLRAVRFSAQLNFTIDKKTYEAIQTNAHLIKNISMERISIELLKILKSNSPSLGIQKLVETDLLKNLFELEFKNYFEAEYFSNNILFLNRTEAYIPVKLYIFIISLFNNISFHDTETILKTLKLDNNTINKTLFIFKSMQDLDLVTSKLSLKKFMSKNEKELIIQSLKLYAQLKNIDKGSKYLDTALEIYNNKEPLTIKDLNITGKDLINELNMESGKVLGEMLNFLLFEVLKNPKFNTKQILISLAKNKSLN
ncbi:MAG: CCA tRNA nucleotidyltransferase [Sarcina sp.]